MVQTPRSTKAWLGQASCLTVTCTVRLGYRVLPGLMVRLGQRLRTTPAERVSGTVPPGWCVLSWRTGPQSLGSSAAGSGAGAGAGAGFGAGGAGAAAGAVPGFGAAGVAPGAGWLSTGTD